jgi:hypothetical protein
MIIKDHGPKNPPAGCNLGLYFHPLSGHLKKENWLSVLSIYIVVLVIGDPQVLMKNKNWRELIFHTKKQKSYFQGLPLVKALGLPNDPAIVQQPVSSNALVGFHKNTPIGSDGYASYGPFAGSNGFYRGRDVNQSYRGRGGGGRGGERPTVNSNRESLKFEEEYDFERANEEFKVMLTAESRRNAGKTKRKFKSVKNHE